MNARHKEKRGGTVLHEVKPMRTTHHQFHGKMRSHAPSKPYLIGTFLLRFHSDTVTGHRPSAHAPQTRWNRCRSRSAPDDASRRFSRLPDTFPRHTTALSCAASHRASTLNAPTARPAYPPPPLVAMIGQCGLSWPWRPC